MDPARLDQVVFGDYFIMESPFLAKEDEPMTGVSHCSYVYCTRCLQYSFVLCSPVSLSSHYTVCFYSNGTERDPNLTVRGF